MLTTLVLAAEAQVVLVDKYQPLGSKKGLRDLTTSKDGMKLKMACYKMGSGFGLVAPGSGLIGTTDPTVVQFDINGEYSRLTFVLAPFFPNSAGDGNYSIVTIKGDDRVLMDEVVFDHDALRNFSLDVKGVHILKFTVLQGGQNVGFGNIKLWKEGQKVVQTANPLNKLPKGPIRLVDQLRPLYIRRTGWVNTLDTSFENGPKKVPSIRINRKEFNSGLQFTADDGFIENNMAWSYFWTNKRYDKISFIVGPRDNQSSNSSAWLIVKADKKVVYEGVVTQKDLAKQVVVDVSGAELVSFHTERRSGDMLASITFGVVDIMAYPPGYTDIPTPGIINVNKDKISQLPDVCPLLSNIRPFSVRGVSKEAYTMFYGESKYITFSMGGYKYNEGLLLTTGNKLFGDMVDAYAEFDLGGEFDWISFDAGCLSKSHALDDDYLRVYADDKLVFDKTIHCTWPNQHYEIPVYKCRTLRFEKPGNGKQKQTIIGVGDIILYRGTPVANNIFEHDIPDCPYETDLIDLCGKPYFHYVGRYVSSLTNFSMDDCFHDGSLMKEAFQMKDGSRINKGFMLEANIPLGLESVTMMDAVFMFMTGAGASLSSSDFAAYSGVTGGSTTGLPIVALLLEDPSQKQASAAAFNPYGQYESCTFTVANKAEHVNSFAQTFGASEENILNKVKLNVFADQRLVGQYWLDNKMQPLTVTVPIFKCHQLMFWLECGDDRSGQYVFYDLKLSKAPCNIPIPTEYTKAVPSSGKSSAASSGNNGKSSKKSKNGKSEERVEWNLGKYSGNSTIDSYFRGVTDFWKKSKEFVSKAYDDPTVNVTWVQAKSGNAYKCVTFSQKGTNRLSVTSMLQQLRQRIDDGEKLKQSIAMLQPQVAAASLAIPSLDSFDKISYFGKYIKIGPKALNQCKDDIDASIAATQRQIDMLESYLGKALDVDGKRSSETVLIIAPEPDEQAPETMQRLDYYDF